MQILDTIIKQEQSTKLNKYLRKIYDFPAICLLLIQYYEDIVKILPEKKGQSSDKARLKEIVFTTFHKIPGEIKSIKNRDPTIITLELFSRIHLHLFIKFEKRGFKLKPVVIKMIREYCKLMQSGNNDFASLFLENIGINIEEKQAGKIVVETNDATCLNWNGSRKQEKEIKRQTKNNIYLKKPFVLGKLIAEKSGASKMDFTSKSLRYFALLLYKLHEAHLINANVGKGYLEMASKRIRCKGKKVTAQRLSKLVCEVFADTVKYGYIIDGVQNIVDEVIKAGNNE